MAQLFLVFAVVGWALMVGALWRVAVMLAGWQSAAAVVMKSDYTESDQWQDRWSLGNTWLTSRGFNWLDGDESRRITDEIVYTPQDGRQRHALVTRQVVRGWMPSGAYVVWYDQSDPDRVTARGPLFWFMLALLGTGLLGVAVHALIRAGGLALAIAQLTGHH